jgi:hypothetical protein
MEKDIVSPEAAQIIEQFQDDLNEMIIENVTDTMSLLCIASVLFSSSLKCYETVLGQEGLVDFMKASTERIEKKSSLDTTPSTNLH